MSPRQLCKPPSLFSTHRNWSSSLFCTNFYDGSPESRRKVCYPMSIHEHPPRGVKRQVKQVGRSKGLELERVARIPRPSRQINLMEYQ
jgi:hypothetical protein